MSSSEGGGDAPTCATLLTRGRLEAAWDHVHARASAPGIDGLTVDRFDPARLDALLVELLAGTWRPRPAKRLRLPADPDRPLAISTVEDRIVQRALADGLQPFYEPRLSPCAWGWRPRRGVQAALTCVERHLAAGRRFFARSDIEKFFDRIPRDRLLARLDADGLDTPTRRLIGRLLKAGLHEGAHLAEPELGTPQGSALSPLLANLYLRPVDAALEAAGHPYLRFGDDLLVLAETSDALRDALALLGDAVRAEGLDLNARKTRTGHLAEGFDFLGARFDAGGRGPSARALAHLGHRAECLVHQPTELAAFATEWTRWYGTPARHADLTLPALAAAALAGLDRARLAARRPALSGALPAGLHLRLAEAWMDLDDGVGRAAALTEARALLARPTSDLDAQRLARVLGVSAGLLPAVAAADASALAAAGHRLLADALRPPLPAGDLAALAPSEEALAALLTRFGGGTPHLVERRDERGHLRLEPTPVALSLPHLRAHLLHGPRRGIHPLREDGTVRFATLTVRVRREAMVPPWIAETADADARRRWATLRGQAHDYVVRLADTARRLSLAPLLEDDACDGRRLWLFFEPPILLRHAHALLARLRIEAGDPSPELSLTALPGSDDAHPPGPRLLLPLALDPRSGRRSLPIDAHGHSLTDPVARFAAPEPTLAPAALGLVRQGPLAPPPIAEDRACLRSLEPRARQVLTGCHLLRALGTKARRLGRLDGLDRQTLYESLAHLPEPEPLAALQVLLAPTGDPPMEIARRLRRAPPCPPACATLRKRHAELAAEVGCDCRFRLVPKSWATPVLHALAPHEVPAFRTPGMRGKARPTSAPPPAPIAEPAAPPAPPPSVQPPQSAHAPAAPATRPIAPAPPPVAPPTLEALIEKLAALHRQLADATRGLARTEAVLDAHFDQAGTDRLPIAHGWLVRRLDARPRFTIEIG